MTTAEARQAYDDRAWQRAYDLLQAEAALDAGDLDRFAVSAAMLGRFDDYFAIRERAYHQAVDEADLLEAASAALWIGIQRMSQGEPGLGSGWLVRAAQHVAEDGSDSVPAGFLLMGQAFGALATGDFERAIELSAEAVAAGRRLRHADLLALALHQEGQFLLEGGRVDEGLARLDEAMIELSGGDLSPMVTGIIYCGVIAGCWEVYELQRAHQWTASMSAWCDSQPDLGNFTSECKVRRAELKHLQGDWDDAWDELAGVSPADVDLWAAGAAACLRGNLDRLQGRFDSAQDNFDEAARLGFDPQPGLALLRLAQGSVQAAAAMARRCLAEAEGDAKRVDTLFAAVEIFLMAGDRQPAIDAVAELHAIAARRAIPIVLTTRAHADAMLQLAEGHADLALRAARVALRGWLTMSAPYEEARARLLVAEACQVLGDVESAKTDRENARRLLLGLAAAPALALLDGASDVLSPRELEVLRILAKGATNRAIAEQLVLSERTVDRHVSNIFSKLGVSTRAAATAYAFERELV